MLYCRLLLFTTSITISVLSRGCWGDDPEGTGPPTSPVLGCWGQPWPTTSMDAVSAPPLGLAPSGCCKYSCTHWLNEIHVFLTFLQSFYIVAGFTTPIFHYRSSLTLGLMSCGRCQGSPPAPQQCCLGSGSRRRPLVTHPPSSNRSLLRRWSWPPGWVTHFLWFYPFLSRVPYLGVCVQYSTTYFVTTTYFNTTYRTNIPISFQTLVGEVALILPFTFQDLHPSATLLAPGDQQEEAPPQQEDQEPARARRHPPPTRQPWNQREYHATL